MVSSLFSNVWSENTGGTGAIKLHLREIVTIAQGNLISNRWAVKQAAAITLANVCTSLGKDITKDQVDVIYPAIVAAVGGKSWDGKEKVLEGYVELVGNFQTIPDEKMNAEAKKIVLREAKRNNKVYQAHALKSLGKFAGYVKNMDLFDEVRDIVSNALEDEDDQENEDKMDIDEKAGKAVRSTKHAIYLNALEALAQAFRPQFYQTEDNLLKVLGYITEPPSSLHLNNYEAKLIQASALEALTSRLTSLPQDATLLKLWDFLLPFAADRGSEDLRTKTVRGAVVNLAKLVTKMGEGRGDIKAKVKGDLEKLIADERSPALRGILEESLKGI